MKGIFIIYAPAIEHEILESMEQAGVKHYTKFPYLYGVGGHSDPHLDTHVWPGSNMGILAIADETAVAKILPLLKKIKEEFLDEGLKTFIFPVEAVI